MDATASTIPDLPSIGFEPAELMRRTPETDTTTRYGKTHDFIDYAARIREPVFVASLNDDAMLGKCDDFAACSTQKPLAGGRFAAGPRRRRQHVQL